MSILVTGLVWKNSRHDGSALLLLLAIADYADDHGVAFPSIPALRRKARLSKSTVFRTLEVLKASGELEIVEQGGGRRTTRYRVIPPAAEQLAILPSRSPRHPPRQGSQIGTGPKSGPQRSLFGTAAVPESGPVVRQGTIKEPSNGVAAATRFEKMPTPAQEAKAFAEQTVDIWRHYRRKPGLERFTDPPAIKNLKTAAQRAWGDGATIKDVTAAIAAHADKPDANPWYLDEWAREARGRREDLELNERAMAHRRAEEQAFLGRRN